LLGVLFWVVLSLRHRWRSQGAGGAFPTGATDTPSEAAVLDLRDGLARRFATLLARLDDSGLLRGARRLTCREVARSASRLPNFDGLAAVAMIAERSRFAERGPPVADLKRASEWLDDVLPRLAVTPA
jgi:hypothetical protein